MPQISDEPATKLPLIVLGAVCFITVFMCQIRFKIAKEIKPEITPPLLKSNYVSMIYGFGKPDHFRLVLRTFIVISSPVLSLMSTGMLMLGKSKSNPYLFLPWLFFTLRGLFFVQTENLMGILKELFDRYDQTYAFCLEDWKWSCLYFTIFFFIIAESFALYEVFEIFMSIWNKEHEDTVKEPQKTDTSDLENTSGASLRPISSAASGIQDFHTITSICRFGLFSDQKSESSLPKLKSLIILNFLASPEEKYGTLLCDMYMPSVVLTVGPLYYLSLRARGLRIILRGYPSSFG